MTLPSKTDSHDDQANAQPSRKLAQPTSNNLEDGDGVASLRDAIEQEVNAVATGFNRDEMPKNMGILIPSLDLQRTIDRIMALITNKEREARIDELKRVPFDIDHPTVGWQYFDKRSKELKQEDNGGR